MNSNLLAKLFDAARMRRLADILAILVMAAMPWSTSATGILVFLWLLAVLATLDISDLRRELATPAGGLPVLLAVLGVLGLLWGDVAWADRVRSVVPFFKLLMIPLLFIQFRRSEWGSWAFATYLAACIALLILSLIFVIWPALNWRGPENDGVPVNDYIAQSGEFLLCAFALVYVALDLFRSHRYAAAIGASLLAAAFLGNIFYVATARTSLVIILVLLVLFGLRHFSWKGIAAVLAGGIVLGAVVWDSSPYLRHRVTNLQYEIQAYEIGNVATPSGERLALWEKSLGFIAEAPVLGHGTGSISQKFREVTTGPIGVIGEAPRNPHNQTFAVAIQLGLVGVAVLWAMWLSHLLLFRPQGLIAWIGLIVVVQNIIGSLFNSHLFDFTQGWQYVFGVGIAGGMVLRQRRELEAPRDPHARAAR